MFGQLAFVILITILASLLVALTLTPLACSRLLRRGPRPRGADLRLGERVLNGLDRFYAQILQWGLRHRVAVVGLMGFVLVGSLVLIPLVGTEFVPDMDSGEVAVVLQLAEGTRGEVTANATTETLKAVDAAPETSASYALAGRPRRGSSQRSGSMRGPTSDGLVDALSIR